VLADLRGHLLDVPEASIYTSYAFALNGSPVNETAPISSIPEIADAKKPPVLDMVEGTQTARTSARPPTPLTPPSQPHMMKIKPTSTLDVSGNCWTWIQWMCKCPRLSWPTSTLTRSQTSTLLLHLLLRLLLPFSSSSSSSPSSSPSTLLLVFFFFSSSSSPSSLLSPHRISPLSLAWI